MGKNISPSRKNLNRQQTNTPTAEQTIAIQNELGLHARAAAAFVKTAFRFKSSIEVVKEAQKANGKSIMGLLTLAAAYGTHITLRAKGPDAKEAVAALVGLINAKFDEE